MRQEHNSHPAIRGGQHHGIDGDVHDASFGGADHRSDATHQGGPLMNCIRPVLGAGAAAAALAALAISASGVAGAAGTDVTGQKYSDAQSALSSAGLKPVVETVVGDQEAWPDCVVTRAQKRTAQPVFNSSTTAT